MFLNCVSDSLLQFKEHVNCTNINYIKLRVFSKCAEKILAIDTQQLKVSSWGWLTEGSQVWWPFFVARERSRLSKLGPAKLNLMLDLSSLLLPSSWKRVDISSCRLSEKINLVLAPTSEFNCRPLKINMIMLNVQLWGFSGETSLLNFNWA